MVIKQAFPTTVAGLVGLNQPAVNALSALLWRYMLIPYGWVQGSGYNACTGKSCIICLEGTKKKFPVLGLYVSRDFRPSVFFINQYCQASLLKHLLKDNGSRAPNHYSCALCFWRIPSCLFASVLELRKLAQTGNLLPQTTRFAGNPARQSRSVHAVNKYCETY
jgi:hypothetical protein